MAAIQSVGRSGDQRIDGELAGIRWAGLTVTYSFPDSLSDYGYDDGGFSRLSGSQAEAVRAILERDAPSAHPGHDGFSVEGFTNLNLSFLGGGSGSGTLRYANNSALTAYAYYPGLVEWGGDVWFGDSGRTPHEGNYHYNTMMHETGHALGLKHGHETDGFGAIPYATNSMEYSIMTYRSYVGSDAQYLYNETWGYAQTFMMYDIAALQHVYGADFTTNAGNTVYSWSPSSGATKVDGQLAISPGGNRIFATVWDGGGNDTYNLSAYTKSLSIDLEPGQHSTFSSAQRAYLGGGPNGGYASGNIYNALQYKGDSRSLIENAIGGAGNDTLLGNAAKNRLEGGAGADHLTGRAAADILIGGSGNDVFHFRLGNSTHAANDTVAAGGGVVAFQGAGTSGGDRFDVSEIDANTSKSGDQAFILGGTGIGHLAIVNSGSDSIVRGNVDGDTPFELEFEIADAGVLASAYKAIDFIL